MKTLLLFLFGLFLGLSSCHSTVSSNNVSAPSSTKTQTSLQFVTGVEAIAQNFFDTSALADTSSVEELPQTIRQLQSIREELQGIDTPPEALQTKAALDSYMDSKIQCYFKRLAPADSLVNGEEKDLCSLSESKLNYFYQQLDKLKE